MTVLERKNIQQDKSLELTQEVYSTFVDYLKNSSGILLGNNKQYLVKNRLARVLKDSEYLSLEDLVTSLANGRAPAIIRAKVLDSMTTNETFWFRDKAHFEILKKSLFPSLTQRKVSPIKIWSAACSSGQEPYSIAFSFDQFRRESGPGNRAGVQILGTDISSSVISDAKKALYNQLSLGRGLSGSMLKDYFDPNRDEWIVKREVASNVRFQQFNLLDNFGHLGKFDIIFIRNVLIYFPESTKRMILEKLVNTLAPEGALFLSSTESLPVGFDNLIQVREHGGRYFRKKV